jgi:lipoyl(octanoyl) transferase
MENGAKADPGAGVEWRISADPVPYPRAVAEMERRVAAIRAGSAPEMVWLLEHPPLYTAGTSAKPRDLLEPGRLPVFVTGRGGQYTYHGPGQRVAYVMFDLTRRGRDVRAFVGALEDWVIRTLARFDLRGERRDGRVGIWIDRERLGGAPGAEDKIAAIGVRVRHWVTYHGLSLNVDPDLEAYRGIVPCGIPSGEGPVYDVTSLAELGISASSAEVDAALMATFDEAFSPLISGAEPPPGGLRSDPDTASHST